MPYEGGTDNQPAEWVEAMLAMEAAYKAVERENDTRKQDEQKDNQRKQQQAGKRKAKQRFVQGG